MSAQRRWMGTAAGLPIPRRRPARPPARPAGSARAATRVTLLGGALLALLVGPGVAGAALASTVPAAAGSAPAFVAAGTPGGSGGTGASTGVATPVVATPGGSAGPAVGDARYYRSSVTRIEPAVPGLQVQVAPSGAAVTLVNHSGKVVIVRGYAGEAYLRIGPSGVDENVASLSSVLNTQATPSPSAFSGPPAKAEWKHRSDEPSFTWRDFRVQWNTPQRPPIVAADPHSAHRVFEWAIQLTVGDQPALVRGSVDWVGAPWVGGEAPIAVAVGALVVVLVALVLLRRSRRRRRRRRREAAARAAAENSGGWATPASARMH